MFDSWKKIITVQFGSKYRGGNFIINEGNTGKLKKNWSLYFIQTVKMQ